MPRQLNLQQGRGRAAVTAVATLAASIRELRKDYVLSGETVHALRGVSLHVSRGEIVTLIGGNGAGKSTLMRAIAGLVKPASGTITFEGKDITHLSPREMRSLRQEMQIVFQDPAESLNGRHTVGQILEEPFIIHGKGTAAQRRTMLRVCKALRSS